MRLCEEHKNKPPAGLEPATPRLRVLCSSRLSYDGTIIDFIQMLILIKFVLEISIFFYYIFHLFISFYYVSF